LIQIKKRIAGILENYDRQGIHRSGTETDANNAGWLAEEIRSLGIDPILTEFALNRIDPIQVGIQVGERSCDGVPFFDCAYTDAIGITGQLGPVGSSAAIAVGEIPPNWRSPDAKPFLESRRKDQHRAMIAVCGGPKFGMPPGIALLNAEHFTAPFGPPVVQVPSTAGSWLLAAAASGTKGRLIAETERTLVTVSNVEALVKGDSAGLAPVVVVTPRSGWFRCTTERGGGIACWLEMMRALRNQNPRREVWFIATTGHELGHLGLKHFISEHGELLKNAHTWIHLGANFATRRASTHFQASDTEMEKLGLEALKEFGIKPDTRRPVGARPFGEAGNIFDSGGRYISLLRESGLFHHPEDRWPDAVDLDKTVRLISAFTKLVVRLANQ